MDERVARIEEERLERHRLIEAEIQARRVEQERRRGMDRQIEMRQMYVNEAETRIKKAEEDRDDKIVDLPL
jgi:hypothetical protein